MRTKLYALMAVLMFGVVTVSAQNDKSMTVRVGETKTASALKVRINLVEVLEDSRCPANVACIWAGRAVIRVTFEGAKGSAKTIDLSTDGEPKVIEIDGHKIHFVSLEPKPSGDVPIGKDDYLAEFRIEKAAKTVKKQKVKKRKGGTD